MKPFLSLVIMTLISTHIFAQGPGSCSSTCNHGDCINNKCVCNPGWFDSNCNTQAFELNARQTVSQSLSRNIWRYFYISLDGIDNDFSLVIEADFSHLKINTLLQVEDSFILPSAQYNRSLTFVAGFGTGSIGFTQKEIQSVNGGKLIVGFHNSFLWSASVSIRVNFGKSETDLSPMGSVMGTVFGIAVITIVISVCIFIKRRMTHHRISLERTSRINSQRNRNRSVGAVVRVEEDENIQVPLRNQQQKVYLTAEEVQAFFPKNQFENMKSSFPQSTCSVCLDEFLKDSECHQLYCEHIFHDICIQEWLSKHDSCPDCRKEMTKKAIEEFLRNPKPKENTDLQNLSAQGQDFFAPTQVEIIIPEERGEIQR